MQDKRLGFLYTPAVGKLLHYTTLDHLNFLKWSENITENELLCLKKIWIWSLKTNLLKTEAIPNCMKHQLSPTQPDFSPALTRPTAPLTLCLKLIGNNAVINRGSSE